MARQITAIDETILPFAPEAVHAVLADLGRYQDWWGPSFTFTTLQDTHGAPGTRVRVQHDRVQWDATLTQVDAERVFIRYDGAWNGETRWQVSPCQEGTRVIYRIDIDPTTLWLRLLARSVDLKRRHSHLMLDVFTHLREHLQRQAAPAAAAALAPARP